MTCVATPTFRLLDTRVGWDPRHDDGLAGVAIVGGALTLAPLRPDLPPDRILPPRLAWMCETCTWWLGTPDGVLRLDPCEEPFAPWLATGAPVVAVAARGLVLAVVVEGEGVRIYDAPTARLVGEFTLASATAVALGPGGLVTVGDRDGILREVDLSGLPCSALDTGGPVARIAFAPSGACRTIVVHEDGRVGIVLGDEISPGDPGTLNEFPSTGIAVATALGFCIEGRGCFDWGGAPLDRSALGPGEVRFPGQGQFLSEALDSGIPGCRWHRVRIDADVPVGTSLQVAIATTDGPAAGRVPQAPPHGLWSTFPGGDPYPGDWSDVPAGALDATISTSPGRYGYIRIRLTGDGLATPAVHQVRLDMPRRTSLDDLPAVYSDDLDARDFSERFLSLFDAELEELDEIIARRPALLDAEALPDDALGWLAGLIGLGFEAEMTVSQRRALIAAAPDLYRRRGTPGGLIDTLLIALGIEATVDELGPSRPWGAVGRARLGEVRLFGRSRARVRLGTTSLGTAPLLSSGDPDDDARLWGANRIVVTISTGSPRALVERVVRSQTPAHVVATVRMRRSGLVLTDLRLGFDTVLVAPRPAIVGETRLGRDGVLRPGRVSRPPALVGKPLLALPTTRME